MSLVPLLFIHALCILVPRNIEHPIEKEREKGSINIFFCCGYFEEGSESKEETVLREAGRSTDVVLYTLPTSSFLLSHHQSVSFAFLPHLVSSINTSIHMRIVALVKKKC